MLREIPVWAMTLVAGHGGQAGTDAGEGVVRSGGREFQAEGTRNKSSKPLRQEILRAREELLHDWGTHSP